MDSEPLRSENHGATQVVHLGSKYDSLDEALLQEIQRFLLSCADSQETRNMVVDLCNTDYFGSGFIEVLFRAYNRIKRKGGKFALSGLKPNPKKVIQVSRLDRIWQLYATADEAVRGLAQQP
jgi:anti-anti-sigma factor